jgi:hypothetical protein
MNDLVAAYNLIRTNSSRATNAPAFNRVRLVLGKKVIRRIETLSIHNRAQRFPPNSSDYHSCQRETKRLTKKNTLLKRFTRAFSHKASVVGMRDPISPRNQVPHCSNLKFATNGRGRFEMRG